MEMVAFCPEVAFIDPQGFMDFLLAGVMLGL
jgi:hypothetical protein